MCVFVKTNKIEQNDCILKLFVGTLYYWFIILKIFKYDKLILQSMKLMKRYTVPVLCIKFNNWHSVTLVATIASQYRVRFRSARHEAESQ